MLKLSLSRGDGRSRYSEFFGQTARSNGRVDRDEKVDARRSGSRADPAGGLEVRAGAGAMGLGPLNDSRLLDYCCDRTTTTGRPPTGGDVGWAMLAVSGGRLPAYDGVPR